MPKALQHKYPTFEYPPGCEVGNDEPREVWQGAMRVVSAKRARKLRKRGVPLMPLHAVYLNPCDAERGQSRAPLAPGNGPGKRSARYAWFECKDDAERRVGRRRLQCYLTATQHDPNTLGRKAELARRLSDQRADHAARAYFRKAATTYYQTFERYAVRVVADVLQGANPQLDLYAAAFLGMFGGDLDRRYEPQAATGVPLPAHWTDEQKRHYIQYGYVVEVGHGDTDGRVHLRSPPVTLYYNGGLADNGEPVGVSQLVDNGPPYNAGVPTHYEPNDYTRSYAAQQHAKYGKPLDEALLDPSYAGASHLDCDCMACRPYTD